MVEWLYVSSTKECQASNVYVVVMLSWFLDRDLNRMYEGSGVVFVRDVPEMGRTIAGLLADEQKIKALSELSKRFMKQKVS